MESGQLQKLGLREGEFWVGGSQSQEAHIHLTPVCLQRGNFRGTGKMAMGLDVWQATWLSHGKSAGTDGETEAWDQSRTQGIGEGRTGVQKEKTMN